MTEARVHLSRGRALFAGEKYDEARAEIERAYALAPNYRLLYDLALCCDALGDRGAAIGYLNRYLAEGGAELDPAQRKQAEELVARLRAHLALVTIRTNVSGDAGVTVDEQAYGEVSGKPLVLLPGARKIWVTKAGYYPASQVVLLKEGDGVEIAFDLKELPHAAPEKRSWRQDRRTLPALIGVLVLSGIVAVAAMRRKKRAGAPPILHLNPYDASGDTKPAQPTPAQTNVLRIDGEAPPPNDTRPLAIIAAVATDIGRVKPSNEDSHLVDVEKGLFVVADGIGGFAGGGVASATAVEAIGAFFAEKNDAGLLTHLPRPAAELTNAVFAANVAIRRKAAANLNIADMGSTCVAARFCLKTRELFITHVGDSRAYRLRGGRLAQLTTDHTMAELGVTGRRAEHLSRALGTEASPRLDVLVARIEPNDTYLFCCDGLSKMLADEAIARALAQAASPTAAVADLVASANERGGLDNITALVVGVALRS